MGKVIVPPSKMATITVHPPRDAQHAIEAPELHIARQDYEDRMKEAASRLEYQMQLAQSLLRGLMLGNGGAIIALLTFIGNTDGSVNESQIWWAFLLYGLGLVGVFGAYLLGFYSQVYFYNSTLAEGWNAQAASVGVKGDHDLMTPYGHGNRFLTAGSASALVSLAAFMGASMFALAAII